MLNYILIFNRKLIATRIVWSFKKGERVTWIITIYLIGIYSQILQMIRSWDVRVASYSR